MTVCIAAITLDNHIVTVSDTMASGVILSADEIVVKASPFHKEWMAMMAGDDITPCVPIIDRAAGYFHNRNNSLAVARAVFKRACQQHLKEMREDAVLGGYGLSMDVFLKTGKRRFTDKIFNSLCDRMEPIELKCEFLIYGFDAIGNPHIFTVVGGGSDAVLDKPGFSAIGCGRWAAEGLLYYLKQNISLSMEETIFNLCAAKFMAERAAGVGQDTYLYVKKPGSDRFVYSSRLINNRFCSRIYG